MKRRQMAKGPCGHEGHLEGECREETSYIGVQKQKGLWVAILHHPPENPQVVSTIVEEFLADDAALVEWAGYLTEKFMQHIKRQNPDAHGFGVEEIKGPKRNG